MPDHVRADPDMLERIAETLRTAGTTVDSARRSAPEAPAAGDVTGEMSVMLDFLSGAASQLSVCVSAIGDGVSRCGEAYREIDESASRGFAEVPKGDL